MADPETAAQVVSLLPSLEPMAGAALAFNLAYLSLPRFRYRHAIRETAGKQLSTLRPDDGSDVPEHFRRSKLYREVEWLAALPDNHPASSNDDSKNNGQRPSGLVARFYANLFNRHQDRFISMVMTGICLLSFFFGTAHSINHLTFSSPFFDGSGAICNLYLLLFCILLPMVFVVAGSQIVKWGHECAVDNVREIAKLMQGDARRVAEAAVATQEQVSPPTS